MQSNEYNAQARPLEQRARQNPTRYVWPAAGLVLLVLIALAVAAPQVFTLPRVLLAAIAAGGLLLAWYKLKPLAPWARSAVKPTDVFLPHGLERAELQTLLQSLDCECAVCRACLVRQQAAGQSGQPMFVLGLDVRKCLFQSGRRAENQTIVQNLMKSLHLPGPVFIFVAEGHDKLLGKTVMNVPGGTILNRNA